VATLRETGEFGLITKLAQTIGSTTRLLVGIGDDAAAWHQPAAGMVATTDMLVEGNHFDLALTGWHDLGWKALAVNLSDIAAMGASPLFAFVSIGLRPETRAEDVIDLYAGMRALSDESGCFVGGGDTVSVRSEIVLNVTVLGSVPVGESDTLLRRDRGRPGDVLAVTGTLGGSAAGLRVLQRGFSSSISVAPPLAAQLIEVHRRPQPRLAAGAALRRVGVKCAMDVSDGLLADLGKLCDASGCGATVHAASLPLHPALRDADPEQARAWAAAGGEDYELLFAAPAAVWRAAAAALAAVGVPVTEIGRLNAERGVRLLDERHQELRPAQTGWDHFA